MQGRRRRGKREASVSAQVSRRADEGGGGVEHSSRSPDLARSIRRRSIDLVPPGTGRGSQQEARSGLGKRGNAPRCRQGSQHTIIMSSESAGKSQMGDDRARTAAAIKPAETSAASSADLESMLKQALVRIDSLERQHEEMKASVERETRALKEDMCRLREENKALQASTEREMKVLRDESRRGESAAMMMQQPRKRAKLSPSATFGDLDNDLLIRCASYLDANGLAQLGRTSARFGIPQAGQQRSLVNEAAHQQLWESTTDEERSRLPKYHDES
ncbi:hypothetical protein THAOC_30842, partial [Thalassiosira oceanica]